MLQILLPAWTVCLDLFFTAIAYGISGIRIPVRAACILSGTGAGCFLAAMELAKWSGLFLPASFCKLAGVVLLAAMGGAMLLKSFVEPADSSEKSANFRTVISMPLVQMRIILAVCRLGKRFCWQLHFLSIRWRLGLELAGKIACQLPLLGQRCSLEFWAFSAEQKSVFGYIVGKNGIIAGSAERVCCCWQCCKQCNNICFT